MKDISILGVTGSIGLNTLEVIRAFPEDFNLVSIASGKNWQKLGEIAREFKPAIVAIAEEKHHQALSRELADFPCNVLAGKSGIIEAAAGSGAEMLISAAVGAAGLPPTLAALDAGLDIGLANKETLVMAGEIVMQKVKVGGNHLLPIDSEHSAIFQCLQCAAHEDVKELVLTASGGPFRGKKKENLNKVTTIEAIAHPTWKMGKKISVDSATLINKALEVIEAHWLFDCAYEQIKVVIHPQSIIHSMVNFVDGTSVAQLGKSDMKIPIQYALTYPRRAKGPVSNFNLSDAGSLTFSEPDYETFSGLSLGYAAGKQGGLTPAVFSAANEIAVELFLEEKISFNQITEAIAETMSAHKNSKHPALADILAADAWARQQVYNKFN